MERKIIRNIYTLEDQQMRDNDLSNVESVIPIFPNLFIRIDYSGTIIDYIASSPESHYSSAELYLGKKIDKIFPSEILGKLYESILQVIRSSSVANLEYALPLKNTYKYYKAKLIPTVNQNILITIREVTRSRKVKNALINSRKRFKSIWNNSLDGMMLVNKKGIVAAVNNSFCELVKKNPPDLIGKHFSEAYQLSDEEDSDNLLSSFESQFIKKEIKVSFEAKIKLQAGEIRYLEVINTFVNADENENSANEEVLLLSIIKDNTGNKSAQQTKLLLEELIDSSQDAIIGCSVNGFIISWNSGAEKIFGYTKNEIIGTTLSILYPEERAEELKILLEQTGAGHKTVNYETDCITKTGFVINASATFSPLEDNSGRINGISLLIHDLTEKKIIEQTLLESEERYRSLIETSPDAIVLVNFEGMLLMGNRLLADMFGFNSIDEIMGRSIFSHVMQQEKLRLLRDVKKIISTGHLKRAEYNLLDNFGELLPVEISASLIVNSMGIPDAIISVIRDITERKAAESALRNSELQFRSVWENSNDGMRLTDENGNIIAVNRAFCKLVEMRESDLMGQPFNYVYLNNEPSHKEESLRVYRKNFIDKTFKAHKQSKSTFYCGKIVELDVTFSMIDLVQSTPHGEILRPMLLAIFHDITERKKVEEELRKNEKHAAIGKMAAYLSHEIKTPLASIKMNIDMLSRSLVIPKEKQKSFQIIQKEVKRLDKLLKNVLQFSRQMDLVFVNINFFSMVNNIKELLKPVLDDRNIKLINRTNQLNVKGDYQKLHSVLLHLIENSIEAIASNGIIEIYFSTDDPGKCISVFIKDSGSGINLPSQIFDPFFTTKSSGTGLGLSIAQKIIEQHNGRIKLLSSKPGETVFEMNFFNK